MLIKLILGGLTMSLLSSCASQKPTIAPIAKKINKKLTKHNDTRIDPYFWLKDKTNKEVISHLNKENDYTSYKLKPVKKLQDTLFKEIKARIKKDNKSVPVRRGDYFYFSKYKKTSERPIYMRRHIKTKKEEIILDENLLARGEKNLSLGGLRVDQKSDILAYAADKIGGLIFTIYFKDLKTGTLLDQKIEKVTRNFTWAEDGIHLFYTKQNPKTLRSEAVYRYNIKTKKSTRVYFEKDVEFDVFVYKSKTNKFIMIESYARESREVLFIPAHKPLDKFKIFSPRQKNHIYSVDHAGDFFLVMSNKKSPNFKIMKTPDNKRTSEKYWKTYLKHRSNVLISDLNVFDTHLALSVRTQGIAEIEIIERKTRKSYIMAQPEKSHVVYVGDNPNYSTDFIRFNYQSMTSPSSTIDYDLKTKKKTIRKVTEVVGGYTASDYESKRIYATANDGAKVPISLVYKKSSIKNGVRPTLLYAYGSYGANMEPWFSSARLSLLDRGFIYAIAHIRGGSEMGRHWYIQGKRLKKKNTFTDFIACAEHLIKTRYTSTDKLYAKGDSAGGLLMGAVLNSRPELFHGAIAGVPFVDVLTTMLDDTIPLTTSEYQEWGNPNIKKYYDYMKSYSPYDNLRSQAYPHMLVTTSLHDSQVSYAEPAKWVAKLRSLKTDQNLLLLHTEMNAGHSGLSGRFESLKSIAREYSFLIGLNKEKI